MKKRKQYNVMKLLINSILIVIMTLNVLFVMSQNTILQEGFKSLLRIGFLFIFAMIGGIKASNDLGDWLDEKVQNK